MNQSLNNLKAPIQTGGRLGGESSRGTVIVAACWLLAVVGFMALLIGYSNSPGSQGMIPRLWPKESHIPRDGRATLVLFAHPRCPCTRATLGELALLVTRCPGQFNAQVLFVRPAGTTEDWAKTDLWQTAAAIPGVSVHEDDCGREAERFHSVTSGETLLYDRAGRLMFQGGITISRGHAGDNPGRSALVALAQVGSASLAQTPVFGCALFEAGCQEGVTACKR